MIFQIIREGIFSVINDIIVTEEIVALEIVGSENVVEGIFERLYLSKLSIELFFEECY